MNRRQLFTSTAAVAASQLIPNSQPEAKAATPKRALMKVGCQTPPSDDKHLAYFRRHGVLNINGYVEDGQKHDTYTVEDLSKLKERWEKHGITLEMVQPPFLASSHIDKTERPAIMLGQSPERDRDIESVQNLIKN